VTLKYTERKSTLGDPYPVVRWYREDGEDIVMRTANNNGGAERLRCK
jgi:hypothetical protein